jgi:putative CocE/NonD family hydrolase
MIVSRLSILLPVTIGLAFAQPDEVLIPMRDGVKLATDLYFPEGPRKDLPVVLERLPYNKKVLAERGAYFAARGYVFAAQDVRGRFRSEGRFEPFLGEGPDGYMVCS